MRILLCPDKFKGSLSAKEVCAALCEGIFDVNNDYDIVFHPMADGGDGSIDLLQNYLNLKANEVDTLDPLGRKIKAKYYTHKTKAFIELASASGLVLLKENERNPKYTSTLGTGLMVVDAFKNGYEVIYLFIGGSATNDGGLGIASALGFTFLDKDENALEPIGKNLALISGIKNEQFEISSKLKFHVLCDVTNPMHGQNGAACIYAAQKGASPLDIKELDDGLKNYAHILKSQINKDLSEIKGMGAAGAVGASLCGLMNVELQNGFEIISNLTQLENAIKTSDLVITGEGKLDATSFQGKVVGNVLSLCKKHSKPCGLVGGMIEEIHNMNSNFIFNKSIISRAQTQEDSMKFAKKYLKEIGKEIGKLKIEF